MKIVLLGLLLSGCVTTAPTSAPIACETLAASFMERHKVGDATVNHSRNPTATVFIVPSALGDGADFMFVIEPRNTVAMTEFLLDKFGEKVVFQKCETTFMGEMMYVEFRTAYVLKQ